MAHKNKYTSLFTKDCSHVASRISISVINTWVHASKTKAVVKQARLLAVRRVLGLQLTFGVLLCIR
jgi:hypothetical protein